MNSGEVSHQLQRAPSEEDRGSWDFAEPPLQALNLNGVDQQSKRLLDTWEQAFAGSPPLQRVTQPSRQTQLLHNQVTSQGQGPSPLDTSSEEESKAASKAELDL